MPHKEYFKEPVVRFEVDRSRFPKVCVVCGRPAIDYVRLTLVENRRYNAGWVDRLYMRPRDLISRPSKSVHLPVCSDHQFTSEDYCRLRLICIVGMVIVGSVALTGYLKIGGSIASGMSIPTWALVSVGLFLVTLALANYALRPRGVEAAFRVIGHDPTFTHIIVDIENQEFRDRFLEENPGTAELVRWILRP